MAFPTEDSGVGAINIEKRSLLHNGKTLNLFDAVECDSRNKNAPTPTPPWSKGVLRRSFLPRRKNLIPLAIYDKSPSASPDWVVRHSLMFPL